MHLKTGIPAVVAILLATSASCTRQAYSEVPVCGYVSEILSDKSSHENELLQGLKNPGSSADISVIGSFAACQKLSGLMITADLHENVSGSCKPDGLPDFAGENVVSIMDRSVPAWRSCVEKGDTSLVRELAVRRAIAAIDTTYNISTYDLDGNGHKNSSKVLILADAWYSSYGSFDVHTLLDATQSKVIVLNPVEVMYDALFEKPGQKLTIGIICDSLYLGSNVYEQNFLERAHNAGIANCDCFCASVDSTEMPLIQFLDKYYNSGRILPLDAILVDDCNVDMGAMQSNLGQLLDYQLPESTSYNKLLEHGVTLMESSSAVAEECYHVLRSSNNFTHRIAYPTSQAYEIGYRQSVPQHPLMMTPYNVQN